jgi:hypothetical protein
MIVWRQGGGALAALDRALARATAAASEAARAALAAEAASLAGAVASVLADPPGGDHRVPWRRTGALHDSIGDAAEGERATVGSTDPAAVDQELGTRSIPPRPFLAPVAAAVALDAASRVGAAAADAIGEALR